MCHQGQMSVFHSFFKFAHHLVKHFHKVQFRHFQGEISGTGFGSFDYIFGQTFQTMCLRIQNLKIFQCFRIFEVQPFQQINVIDDGSQRRFQIMGDIGDQFGFHTLIFEAFFHGSVQPVTNAVDILCHCFLITTEFLFRDLVSELSIGDPFQAIKEEFPSKSNFVDAEKRTQIQKK